MFFCVCVSDEHIQKKVVALRNTFTRELRLLRDSKKSGLWAAVRKPTWPFYSAMQFLRGVINIITPATANIVRLYSEFAYVLLSNFGEL